MTNPVVIEHFNGYYVANGYAAWGPDDIELPEPDEPDTEDTPKTVLDYCIEYDARPLPSRPYTDDMGYNEWKSQL
jgi:hypothetical protein